MTSDQWPEPPPAPVVTEEGVYGTLPRLVLGDLERREGRRYPAWARGAAVAFAIFAGLWLAVLSGAQATSRTVAIPATAQVLDTMTGLGGLLALNAEAIRAEAAQAASPDDPIAIPGLEVATPLLTAGEVQEGDVESWQGLARERLAAAAYEQGMDALTIMGTPSDGGAFSTSGAARLLVETLSAANHRLAGFLVWPLGLTALLAAIGVVALSRDPRGFGALGAAAVVAALPTAGLGLLALGVVLVAGSDGTPLAEETARVAGIIARLPLRNAAAMAAGGIVVGLPAAIVALVLERLDDRAAGLAP